VSDTREQLVTYIYNQRGTGSLASATAAADYLLETVKQAGLVVMDPAEITELRRKLKNRAEDCEALRRELADQERALRDMEGDLQRAESALVGVQMEDGGY
jgi:guanylate kinase